MGDRLPKTQPEIYAREQVLLHERQSTEIVLQAIRIGDIAIASTPNETYALTGLKLKRQSPLSKTMVIELANGGDGYIPPPEQHYLGGYNTWAARSAGLEVSAEPRIVAANLLLLERVSKLPRRTLDQSLGPAAQSILDLQPLAYWRLDEMSGPTALDSSGAGRTATYEPGVVYFLEGPGQNASNAADSDRRQFTNKQEINRAAHFAGGRITTLLPELGQDYSVALSFWNGMPFEARSVAGWMFSRDYGYSTSPQGLHLGLCGDGENAGKLILQSGLDTTVFGKSTFKRWSWGRLVLIKSGRSVRIYAANAERPEIELELPPQVAAAQVANLFMGGQSDNAQNWEGKLDEIAIFDRGLNERELAKVFAGN